MLFQEEGYNGGKKDPPPVEVDSRHEKQGGSSMFRI